ncbi:MAG: hypothetical protein H0V44_12730 [Planctomycetes bacterium]|nr:hypothetical protein [Planctomycetota bacterium]
MFPGRLRIFCDERLTAALPAECTREWVGLASDALAAAACGAAVAEAERGGRVLVVVRDIDGGMFAEAATLAGRLRLDNLHVVLAADEPALLVRFGRDASDLPWGQTSTTTVSLTPTGVGHGSAVDSYRGAPPVHLAALGLGGVPPWPIDAAAAPRAAAHAALAWLSEREPRLLAVHSDAVWSRIPDSLAKLFALAHLCSEGRRVAWLVPDGTRMLGWLDALSDIGARGLGLKLLVASAALPSIDHLSAIAGWWVTEPADASEVGAVLAQTLDTEDSMIIALPRAAAQAHRGAPWSPGSGRWIATGDAITLACRASSLASAISARELLDAAGIAAGVYQCTSLVPVPGHDLATAAARGPLLVVDVDDASRGIARAIAGELGGDRRARFDAIGAAPGSELTAADIAQAARALIARS